MSNQAKQTHSKMQNTGNFVSKVFSALMSVILVVGLMSALDLQNAYASTTDVPAVTSTTDVPAVASTANNTTDVPEVASAVNDTAATAITNNAASTNNTLDKDSLSPAPVASLAPDQDDDGAYLLTSYDDLAWFSDYVNAGHYNVDAKVVNDIDCGNVDWVPIGLYDDGQNYMDASPDCAYKGTFDGNHHTITMVDATTSYDNYAYFGFFQALGVGSVVKDLTLDGSFTTTRELPRIAAFTAVSYGATITGCVNKMDISALMGNGFAYAGGFIARDYGSTIVNCGNEGNITASCQATGTGTSSASCHVGGVIGRSDQDSSYGGQTVVENCYNWGNISASKAEKSDSYSAAYAAAGGFIGWSMFNADTKADYFYNCYNAGTVTVTEEDVATDRAGAIAGHVGPNRVSSTATYTTNIQHCYWAADTYLNAYGEKSSGTNVVVDTTGSETYSDKTTLLNNLNGQKSPDGASGAEYLVWYPYPDESDSAHYELPCFIEPPIPEPSRVTFDANGGYFDDSGSSAISRWNGSDATPKDQLSKDDEGAYLITSAADLAGFRDIVNGGEYNASATLTINCDMSAGTWEPIAPHTTAYTQEGDSYKGTFDGANHTITFAEDISNTTDNYASWGLFGAVGLDGTIKNVALAGSVNATSTGTNLYVGGIAALSYGGTFEGCINRMENLSVTAPSPYAAGIVAFDTGSVVLNCGNVAPITVTGIGVTSGTSVYGYGVVGGIVAKQYFASSYGLGYSTIGNCYNQAHVSSAVAQVSSFGDDVAAGGIVGMTCSPAASRYTLTMDNCYSSANATAASADRGGALVGVVAAPNDAGYTQAFSNLYWADDTSSWYGTITASAYTEDNCQTYTDVDALLSSLNSSLSQNSNYLLWIKGTNGLPCFESDVVITLTADTDGTLSTDEKNKYKEPKRDGYNFLGWTSDRAGKTTLLSKDDILSRTFDEDATFYAQWEAISYTIDIDDEQRHGSITVESTANYLDTVEVVVNGIDEGYKIVGLKIVGADSSEEITDDCDLTVVAYGVYTFSMPAQDIIIYPVWSEAYKVSVTNTPSVGGSVAVSVEDVDIDIAAAGENVALTLQAVPGYVLGSFTVDGEMLTPPENTSAYTYSFTMPAHAVEITATWLEILDADMFTIDTSDETYTSKPIEKSITSSYLPEGSFEATYQDNINVGSAKITITGVGAYTGTVIFYFDILPADATIKCLNASKVFGEEDPTLVYEVSGLCGTDTLGEITLERDVGEDAGTYAITAVYEGNDNYNVTIEGATFTIERASIESATISGIADKYYYTGEAIDPAPTVKLNATTLVVKTDYEVTYADNVEVGTATISIMGIGNYTGVLRTTFEIITDGGTPPTPDPEPTPKTLSESMFEVDTHWEIYDGVPITKDIKGADGDKTLVEGVDYTVTYTDNDHADEGLVDYATITICGIGDYEGTLTYNFAILGIFTDVWPYGDDNEWYFDAVYSLAAINVVTGYAPDHTIYGVGDSITRADFVTMLWRYCEPDEYASYNEATAKNTSGLPDVEDGMYYTGAINWAVKSEVVTGYNLGGGNYEFRPYNSMSFEEMVVVLVRYVIGFDEAENYDTSALSDPKFTDAGEVSDFARGAMSWAIENELVTGNDNHDGTFTINPLEYVARERTATVMWREIDTGLLIPHKD